MNILDQGTFILVTDSEKALLLENITDAQDPHFEVRRKEEQENPSDREQSANRPGRKQDTGVANGPRWTTPTGMNWPKSALQMILRICSMSGHTAASLVR